MEEFKKKIIAFVDILGFKSMVDKVEDGPGLTISELKEIKALLAQKDKLEAYKFHGPTTCPNSSYLNKDLDFKVWQPTDCVVLSCEISPAGAINIVSHCWIAALSLLMKGIMVRGYITIGNILHEDNDVTGTGYHKALDKEGKVSVFKKSADERGTPFIEIDPEITEYIYKNDDGCIRMMLERLTEGDGNLRAIYPFKRLSHDYIIAGHGVKFDPAKEKAANQIMRENINRFKAEVLSFADQSNSKAMIKTNHYIECLDKQLDICDITEDTIDKLCKRIGT